MAKRIRRILIKRDGLTVLELVFALIMILIIMLVLYAATNPPEMFKRGRDGRRISDLKTLDSVLGLLRRDQPTLNFGNSSSVYVSVYDPAATTTAGSNCASLGLPALGGGYTYACAASSTYRKLDGTGWLRVNFLSSTLGLPFQNLNYDPKNTTSTGLYYTYVYQNADWELTANLESSAYISGGSKDRESTDGGTDSNRYEFGTNLNLTP